MGIAATINVVNSYSTEYCTILAEQALLEPSTEIQLACVKFLLKTKPESIILNFSNLLNSSKQMIVKERFILCRSAEKLLKNTTLDNARVIYNMLDEIGNIEQLDFFATGIKLNDPEIKAICIKKIDKIVDWYLSTDKETAVQYTSLITTLVNEMANNWEYYMDANYLDLIFKLDIYDVVKKILLHIPQHPMYNDFSNLIRIDSSNQCIQVVFKLLYEKDYRLWNYGRNALLNKKDSQTAHIFVEKITHLDIDYLKDLNKKISLLEYFKDARLDGEVDKDTFRKFILCLFKLKETEQEIDTCINNFLESNNPQIQIICLQVLKEIEYPNLCKFAIKALNSQSNDVQLSALKILQNYNFDDKIKIISPLLNNESNEVKSAVMEQIAVISFNRYIESFDKLDKDKREEMARALSKLDENLTEKLTMELSSMDPSKRLKALRIAQLTNKSQELNDLLIELLGDPDVKVRSTAIRMVQFGKSISALSTLIELLSHSDRRVRANAIEAIEELGDKRFVPVMQKLLNDTDNRCRANALKCLWKLDAKQQALEGLYKMIAHQDYTMRLSAIWLISELKFESWDKVLFDRLEKEINPDVRKKIKEVLACASKPN